MEALSTMGISAATLSTLSQDGLAELTDDPTEDIPILVGHRHDYPDGYDQPPEVEPVHKTIPYDRYAKIQAALNASQRVEQNNPQLSEAKGVSVGIQYNTTSKYDVDIDVVVYHTTREVLVRNDNSESGTGPEGSQNPPAELQRRTIKPDLAIEDVKTNAPASAKGTFAYGQYKQEFDFPVAVKAREEVQDAFEEAYRPVVGGCRTELDALGNGGTLCFSVWDPQYERRLMLSSGHVVDEDTTFYQPSAYDKLGYPTDYIVESAFDAGLIDTIDGPDNIPGIAEVDASLVGTRSWDWITSEGYSDSYIRQGSTTGRHSGTTTNVFNTSQQKFGTDIYSEKGDSGGPYFDISGDDYWLIGLHNWHTGGDNHGVGNGIEHVEDRMDVIV